MRGFSHERRGVPWLAIPTFLYKRSTIWNLASAEVHVCPLTLLAIRRHAGLVFSVSKRPNLWTMRSTHEGVLEEASGVVAIMLQGLQQNSKRERSHREPSVYFAVFLQAPTGRTPSER